MAIDYDITERIPHSLSNPSLTTNYVLDAEAYDIAISGQPFFLMTNDETPYRRETAQYRKQQIDQTNEPGEQSITGWWVRAQSSFHKGEGINYYDPSAGETVNHRFYDSKGVNVWEKGKVTLLKSCFENHITTGAIASNGRPQQTVRSIKWNEINGVLLQDEYDVDKVYNPITYAITNKALASNVATLTTSVAHKYLVGTMVTITGVDATFNGEYEVTAVTSTTFSYAKTYAGTISSTAVTPNGAASSTLTHFIDYNSGTDYPVYSMCDDGVTAFWVTNRPVGANQRLTVYKKLLTGSKSTSDTQMFQDTSTTISNAIMNFVKGRIVACFNNVVYEFSSTAGSLPSAIYTNPASAHVYTSITASGTAIYISGYNGIQSTIEKYTLGSNGTMPVITSPITAAEMPEGEIIHKIFYYYGFMMIGTSKGVRAAIVSDQDGSIAYGPLIVETTQPCYDFAARDRYVWCATGVDGEPGLIRMNLDDEVETLRFAYANDLYYPGTTGHVTTGVAFAGDLNRLMFSTAYANSENGHVYRENESTLMSTGYIQTGKIRYATLENKVFKNLKPRFDSNNGGLFIQSIDSANNEYTIGNFPQTSTVSEVGISLPIGAQEYLSFKFTLTPSTSDSTLGPILSGYQLKALPAIPRQRLIQYPLACYDRELDSFGIQVGYEGSAYDKLVALEATESAGDTVRLEDFRTGETYLGVIEQLQFINKTPSDKRFSGFGGMLLLTIRTL
jgi:hypothetical protein